MWTVEKLTVENMGIAFGIYLYMAQNPRWGVIYPYPQLQRTF